MDGVLVQTVVPRRLDKDRPPLFAPHIPHSQLKLSRVTAYSEIEEIALLPGIVAFFMFNECSMFTIGLMVQRKMV
jgi:hypothetical protein